jgi:hypothetical protein
LLGFGFYFTRSGVKIRTDPAAIKRLKMRIKEFADAAGLDPEIRQAGEDATTGYRQRVKPGGPPNRQDRH